MLIFELQTEGESQHEGEDDGEQDGGEKKEKHQPRQTHARSATRLVYLPPRKEGGGAGNGVITVEELGVDVEEKRR